MALLISVLFVVAGAVLVWAIDGLTIPGVILMSVGALGALASTVLPGRAVPSQGAVDEAGSPSGARLVEVGRGRDEDERPLEHGWPE
jgi:hypothetical protein